MVMVIGKTNVVFALAEQKAYTFAIVKAYNSLVMRYRLEG